MAGEGVCVRMCVRVCACVCVCVCVCVKALLLAGLRRSPHSEKKEVKSPDRGLFVLGSKRHCSLSLSLSHTLSFSPPLSVSLSLSL